MLERSVKSSSKEKPFLTADLSTDNKVTVAKKGLRVTRETERASSSEKDEKNGGKCQQNVGKPKPAVKLATKKMTNENLLTETTLRRSRGRPSGKEKGTKLSHEEENGGVEDEVLDETGSDAKGKETQQRELKSASPKQEELESTVCPDGGDRTPAKDSCSPSPKLSPCSLKRRKSLYGYRKKPAQESLRKMKKAQSLAESKPPRKRRKLVNQEQSEEPVASQQGLTNSVVSSRPSRVIRVPKRFMDDEGMSGLLGKKVDQTENQEDESGSDTEDAKLSQTPKSGGKQKSVNKRTICGGDENLFGKSVEWKPSDLTGGPRKKVGRPAYDATSLKIYERLKMLTTSLAQRKEQRMASARSKALFEKVETESHGVGESPGSRELRKWGSTDLKIGDLNCPGVVHKVAIHTDDQVISQAALLPVEGLETKADGKESDVTFTFKYECMQTLQHLFFLPERIGLEGATNLPGTDTEKSEVVLAQGSSIHKINISGANKRMLHLLKRAKVQLIKIDQQKQMKTAQVRSCM